MENLAYYNSSILDINSQDDLLDQTDIMRKNNLQYQCDSIIETIVFGNYSITHRDFAYKLLENTLPVGNNRILSNG